MNQEILQKAKILDKRISNLQELNQAFSKNVRIRIEAMQCSEIGTLSPVFGSEIIRNLFEPELIELIRNWSSQKLNEMQKELELL
jgi:hypothetical protein